MQVLILLWLGTIVVIEAWTYTSLPRLAVTLTDSTRHCGGSRGGSTLVDKRRVLAYKKYIRTTFSRLQQSNDHQEQSKYIPDREAVTTMLLDKMLNQAANLAMASMKNESTETPDNNSNNDTNTTGNITNKSKTFNLPLAFASHYSKKLLFNQTKMALQYLSLPARNYSVLNSTVVMKSPDDESTFLIKLPLRDFAAALDSISPQVNYRALGQYVLATSISVNPQPETGKVLMSSGPFYFLPDTFNKSISGDGSSNMSNNAVSIQSIIAQDILPTWLVWGGAVATGGGSNVLSTTVEPATKHSEGSDSPNVNDQDDQNESPEVVQSNTGFKSSVQPTLIIELKWDPQAEAHKSQPSRVGQWNRAVQSWWKKTTTNEVSDNHQQLEDDYLTVKLKVAVKMEMNIPLPQRIGKALAVLPVKLLIQQAGSLVISTFLHNLIPPFTKLLIRDYERRNNATLSNP